MGTKITLVFALCLSMTAVVAQELKTADDVRSVMADYKSEVGDANYNFRLLNRFFANEITSFASSIKDQSIEKYFLNANTDLKMLSIGRSFDFRDVIPDKDRRNLAKLSDVLTVYVQSGLENGFATVYAKNKTEDKYEFSNNLGVGFRFTHFFGGHIWVCNDRQADINYVRDALVAPYIASEIKSSFGAAAIHTEAVNREIREERAIALLNGKDEDEAQAKVYNKKYYELYGKIVDKEAELFKKTKAYTFAYTWWVSGEIFKPLTDKIINSTLDSVVVNENRVREWRAEISLHGLLTHSSGTSLRAKFTYSRFSTNNFLISNASTISIQDFVDMTDTTSVINSTKAAYYGLFEEKNATTFRGEAALLFLNNTIGLSGGYEKYRHFDIENWKLGIPISLKDKDNKPTVNFEIVWREWNKQHVIGINAVYSFGKFIK